MRRWYSHSPLFALLLLLMALSARAATRTIDLQGDPQLQIALRGEGVVGFQAQVGLLTATEVVTPRGEFTRLLIPGFHTAGQTGEPELPVINRLVEIPYGASVDIEIVGYETQVIHLADYGVLHPIMPVQPSLPKSADPAGQLFCWEEDKYRSEGSRSSDMVTLTELGWLRGLRLGRLSVSPVAYDPTSGTITVTKKIRFNLRFRDADPAEEEYLKQRTRSPFFEMVYDRIVRSRPPHHDHPDHVRGPVKYVIVSDRSFDPYLQPFVKWKTEQGFTVVEAYTDTEEVGNTALSIRYYLRRLYDAGTPEDPAPTFVLFVGDVDVIPCYFLNGPTDLPYCDTTGDDIPDMYYGRFSIADESQLVSMIEKTLLYEQCRMPDPSYLGRAVMIAGMDDCYAETYGNAQINYATRHYFNLEHGIDSRAYLYPESGLHSETIRKDIADGLAFVNYAGHGDESGWWNPSFQRPYVRQLMNKHKYCLAVGNCCLTSRFDLSECFAETWLREDSKGAIGYIGAANETFWDEDYWWAVGFGPVVPRGADYEHTGLGAYDGMFHDYGEDIDQWYVVQDAMIFCGNLAVEESGSDLNTYYWRVYNLMGDPSLSPFLGVPTANEIVHDYSIEPDEPLTETFFHVTAEPNSYVGLSKQGTLVGCGLVDASGYAEIEVSGQGQAGTVRLCVTCQNRLPYRVDIPVLIASDVKEPSSSMEPLLCIAPNPFSRETEIRFHLLHPRDVSLRIHDVTGRTMQTILSTGLPAGTHRYVWDGRGVNGKRLPEGVYLARLATDFTNESRTWKVILRK